MVWLKWDAIDWEHRILNIQKTVCEATGEDWVPKDYEARRLDVKEACIDYLECERNRQEEAELRGPFVLPAGTYKNCSQDARLMPLYPDSPGRSFGKMAKREKLGITLYSLRHTYATMALRAGVDLSTVQRNMGHSDIRTTMGYFHHIQPEQHPMDKLPY